MALKELHEKLVSKQIGAEELCRSYIDKIKASDGEINSFITLCEGEAMTAAAAAQKKIDSGEAGAL